MPVALTIVADHLNDVLSLPATPDYPNALNGVQVDHRGPVAKIAAAVDASHRTIQATIEAQANLLIVHHGLFWNGLRPITGLMYDRVATLLAHDIAVYSAHLPLDRHPTLGNNILLARALELEPDDTFAQFGAIAIGVRGHVEDADLPTSTLLARAHAFAHQHGGTAIASHIAPDRRTRHWAICTGGGASADTIREAVSLGVDTLIVGEGPHWTAVDAPEHGLVIIYAGHYATETLGVMALAEHTSKMFGVPWVFIPAPTGL